MTNKSKIYCVEIHYDYCECIQIQATSAKKAVECVRQKHEQGYFREEDGYFRKVSDSLRVKLSRQKPDANKRTFYFGEAL